MSDLGLYRVSVSAGTRARLEAYCATFGIAPSEVDATAERILNTALAELTTDLLDPPRQEIP